MESPSSGVRKVEMGDGESTESVVLQCTSLGEVEDGEEVVRGEPAVSAVVHAYTKKLVRRVLEKSCGDGEDCVEEVGDVVSESDDVVSVRGVDRSLGGRKSVVPWLINFQNENAYWRSGVRTARCRAPKSYLNVGETFEVDTIPIKRKHEEEDECGPISESEFYEETDSGDSSASSSDSETSGSESAQWQRKAGINKRRRGGDDVNGSIPFSDESFQLKSGLRRNAFTGQHGTIDCDNKFLKEMQELLELQLQASERREAGMKQRMETMMDLMSQHMGHVDKRVCKIEVGAQPHEEVLERINMKLEKVMEGFTTLNENLSILSACLSRNLDSQ